MCKDTNVFISGLMQHAQYMLSSSHDDGSTSQDLV